MKYLGITDKKTVFSCIVNVLHVIPVTYKCPFAGDLYICTHCLSFDVSFKTWYETHKEIAWNRFTRKKYWSMPRNIICPENLSACGQDRAVHPLFLPINAGYIFFRMVTLLTPNHQRISKDFFLLLMILVLNDTIIQKIN